MQQNEIQELVRSVNISAKDYYAYEYNGVRPPIEISEEGRLTEEAFREALVSGLIQYSEGDITRENVEIYNIVKEITSGAENNKELFERMLEDPRLQEQTIIKFEKEHPEKMEEYFREHPEEEREDTGHSK